VSLSWGFPKHTDVEYDTPIPATTLPVVVVVGTVDRRRLMGLDHRIGHFLPLRIMAESLEGLVLSIVKCFCVIQKQKEVADAMIETG
jgi:hypothetical protein